MQKPVVLPSTARYTACPAFAVLRYVTWSLTSHILKHSRNFWTCSRRSFTFIDLNFSQDQTGCCPSLKGHSKFLGLLDSSAFEAKYSSSVYHGFEICYCQTTSLSMSNDEFVCSPELQLWRQATL